MIKTILKTIMSTKFLSIFLLSLNLTTQLCEIFLINPLFEYDVEERIPPVDSLIQAIEEGANTAERKQEEPLTDEIKKRIITKLKEYLQTNYNFLCKMPEKRQLILEQPVKYFMKTIYPGTSLTQILTDNSNGQQIINDKDQSPYNKNLFSEKAM
jgi:hypothetical protein